MLEITLTEGHTISYTRVDDLVGDIVTMLAALTQDRLEKFKWEGRDGRLDDGGDDTFFDYCRNGLHTISNVALLLTNFHTDEFIEGMFDGETLTKYLKECAHGHGMQDDFYFQDCVGDDEVDIITELYELAGLQRED